MKNALPPLTAEMLAATMASLPDPAFILSRSGRYVAVFGGSDKRYYHDGSGLVGLSIGDVLEDEKTCWFLREIDTALNTRGLHVLEYGLSGNDVKGLDKDGPKDTIWFEGRVQALDFRVGGEEVVLWVASNITASHRLRQELADSLRREQDNSFQQRQFIGVVAHEFRTPLSVIDAVLTNLQLAPPTHAKDLAQRVATIESANNQLIMLTDTCLADARLDAGLRVDERLPIDLCALLRESAEIVDPLTAVNWLRFQCRATHGPRSQCQTRQVCSTKGSPGLMRIALTNLLDNARKYAPESQIDVSLETDVSTWRMRLRDHGPGIAATDHERIFDRFSRGRDVNATKGNGLGLYVSREIVRSHGGELRLLSSDADGTVFEISLPQVFPTLTRQHANGANT
jgi:signal transduction histidine kinase